MQLATYICMCIARLYFLLSYLSDHNIIYLFLIHISCFNGIYIISSLENVSNISYVYVIRISILHFKNKARDNATHIIKMLCLIKAENMSL